MEEQPTYGVPDYTEKVQSQLPALHLLMKLGWSYLTPEEALALRGGRTASALLDDVLAESLREANTYDFKGRTHRFTENGIMTAVQALKGFRAEGALHQNEKVYDLLCLGTSVPQTVDGDTKSFTVNYIDWKHPENNTYHCTAEFSVERIGLDKHYIPDIVLFINGIPVCVIECKRSAYPDTRKKPIELAVKQQRDYQEKNGIPQLYLYSQLLLALARSEASFGTTGTPLKFWSVWKEDGLDTPVQQLLLSPLSQDEADRLLSDPFLKIKREYLDIMREGRAVTEQDRCLYALCRPERFLDLVYKFIVYDNGEKKIARYQQYFTVKNILERVRNTDADGTRKGGVVWHTQGSGKSLTMVMLAKSLAIEPDILNPKVVLVTDRIDLDDQICNTFRACGLDPEQANTGTHLIDLLQDHRTHVVTTLIHKFAKAVANRRMKRADPNTFVLVDEGHRTQYSDRHAQMKLSLKGACFIAFTGTPLAKSRKRNTFAQFGDLFKPAYTIRDAVEDKAVVPLLYEPRHVPQTVQSDMIDSWFEKMTMGLTDEQKSDLKRKFATKDHLNKAAQKVRMITWDVCQHYSTHWQGTGLKGQLVAQDKATALLYKKYMGEFDMVSTEVLISGPDVREGEDTDKADDKGVEVFWKKMMDRFGTEKKYNRQIINSFTRGDHPEIIIVVDKLLTGFDAPCNTVLYLTRKLKEHTLLQAIARVNRLHDRKDFGFILDYRGVIEELDEAIDFYSQLADYEPEDLKQTVTNIEEEVAKLPQHHTDLWELFTPVKGSKDPEAYENYLWDEALRTKFYDRFSLFARTLSLAMSSTTFLDSTPEQKIMRYKKDLKFFQNLRAAASRRYQEVIDYSAYEPKIQKLIDTHVGTGEVEQLSPPIDLFDDTERRQVIEDTGKSDASKADTIASATARVIEQEMRKDRAFYEKFSKLLQEVIRAYHEERIQSLEYLEKIHEISEKVISRTDDDLPDLIQGHDMARRYFGCVCETLAHYGSTQDSIARVAIAINEQIDKQKIRDWYHNPDVLNRMRGDLDDVIYDYEDEHGFQFSDDEHEAIIDRCIETAIANED